MENKPDQPVEDRRKSFIGAKKVKETKETEFRTPGGATMIDVVFDDGTVERMSHSRYTLLHSFRASDATTCQKLLVDKIAPVVYGYMHEFDLRLEEVDPVLNEVVALINAGVERATNLLFGVNHAQRRSLMSVNQILKKNYDSIHKSADGTPPEGGKPDSPDQKPI